jgi:crotonobetainyl-CoA:carnitine CoA-transferase CaiB-like acyl-CoA transferase
LKPLSGIRVLDLGIITAGAVTSAILADFGAEVIKIESEVYPDPFRQWFGDERDSNRKTTTGFDYNNRNKLGVSLNLKNPSDRMEFLRLVKLSDVVVENFRRGVMEGLGLDYTTLKHENKQIVVAAITSQGSGHDATVTSYGSTLEATGGLSSVTGYRGLSPLITGRNLNYPDQIVCLFAAGAIMAGILSARATGRGAYIEISQRELTTYLLGDLIANNSLRYSGETLKPKGNTDTSVFLQQCFKCRDDRWIAVRLKREIMVANLLKVPAGGNTRAILTSWCKLRPAVSAVESLVKAGVAAYQVLHGEEAFALLQQHKRPVFAQSPSGKTVKGFPYVSKYQPLEIYADAPALGEHTQAFLSKTLI